MGYSEELLYQFKQEYKRNGKYNLVVQIPHLARLADYYQNKYRATRHWPDCVKAHALYNSIATREPQSPEWKRKAFAVQQDFSDANPLFDFQHQLDLTNSLKADLQSVRNQSRHAMMNMDDLAEKYDDSKTGVDNSFFKLMAEISLNCSNRMTDFACRVIKESSHILKQDKPPCDFVAVSIGSLARGEATPYSDLEYLFLVEDMSSPETVDYFEKLAMASYFQITNLGETKLAYMSIAELEGWFGDTAKNGFKIDGLAEKAGNIPTGNGSSSQRNHFIVTPQELAERYREVLENPDRDTALRGDLTAMLTYMKPIFTHKTNNRDLLMELKQLIQKCSVNETRCDVNREMLETDVKKFNFTPNYQLAKKGFAADVKKEIYRFPSILLLDIAIVTQTSGNTSWESVKLLQSENHISDDVNAALELLLAAAAYIRLSAYLYHDSQDDRMSVSQVMTPSQQTKSSVSAKSQRRWFVPSSLFIAMCSRMILLKRTMTKNSNIVEGLKSLALDTNDNWPRLITLYYTGRYRETLNTLRQIYGDSLCDNPISVTQNMPSGQSEYDTLYIISETLFWCNEYKAALVLYKHMTDNTIYDRRERIADCYRELGDYNKAVTVLESITDKSVAVYFALGNAYGMRKEYNKSEQSFLQALEHDYSDISSEEQYDYYGDPIATNEPTKIEKISFTTITSREERLSRIINSTPDVIACVTSLGVAYNNQGQYTLADSYYKKSLHLISELYGEGAAVQSTARALNNLGINCSDMGQYSEAEDSYKQTLAIYRNLSQGAVSSDIANTLYNLGINYSKMEQHSEAEDSFKQALAIYRNLAQGADSSDIARALNNLGVNYIAMGQYGEADDSYKQALAIYRNLSQGAAGIDIANTLYNLGNNYSEMGQYNEAEDSYKQALAIYRNLSQGADSSAIANTLYNLGINYKAAGDKSQAVETFREALDMYIRVEPDNPRVGRICRYLVKRGSLFDEGMTDKMPGALVNLARKLNKKGQKHYRRKEYTQAEECYRQVLEVYRALSDNSSIALTLSNLACIYMDMEDRSKADEKFREAIDFYTDIETGNKQISRIRHYLTLILVTSTS